MENVAKICSRFKHLERRVGILGYSLIADNIITLEKPGHEQKVFEHLDQLDWFIGGLEYSHKVNKLPLCGMADAGPPKQ